MKQTKKIILLLLLTVSATILLCSFSTFRGEDGKGQANVVSGQTPINTEKGGTIWTRSFSSGGTTSYNSSPIITDSALYIVNGSTLYELDLKGNITRQMTLSAKMNSVCYMLLEEDNLYIPLAGGIMECVNISTMRSVWTSEAFGGQSLSTVFYHNGYLYTGTASMKNVSDTTGLFYCLKASDGSTVWTYQDNEHPGGYYWSGSLVHGNALYFAGDNGILVSHSLVDDEVYDTYVLSSTAKIRSGITYDEDTNALYTAGNNGQLYKITVTRDGQISKVTSASVVPGAASINCTSTPTIYNKRLYIGSLADSFGYLSVMDADTLSVIYTVKGTKNAEIKSSPLVSAGYASAYNNEQVYVYVSANCPPGGIYYITDDKTARSSTMQTLYIPAAAKQFCLSSIASGEDGTLYYSNDSGTLFAVREVSVSSDRIAAPTPVPPSTITKTPASPTPSAVPGSTSTTQKKSSSAKKPKAPVKIKYKKKKKTISITWKKKTKNSQTLVYVKYGSGKWKKTVVKKNSKLTIKRKKKKMRIRLRSRLKQKKKWYYSSYTKIYRM